MIPPAGDPGYAPGVEAQIPPGWSAPPPAPVGPQHPVAYYGAPPVGPPVPPGYPYPPPPPQPNNTGKVLAAVGGAAALLIVLAVVVVVLTSGGDKSAPRFVTPAADATTAATPATRTVTVKGRASQRPRSSPSPSSLPSSGGGAARGTSCGGGLSVGPHTTCGFAQNVQEAFESAGGTGGSVEAYSPATGTSYTMQCSGGVPHVCTGGNDASVYIR